MDMDIAIKVVAVLIMMAGVVYTVRPAVMVALIEFFKKGNRLYAAAAVRLALAVLFLSAWNDCRRRWIIFAFGILFMVSAVLIFVLGPQKFSPMMGWYQKQSSMVLRVFAAVTIIFGAVILYAA